MSEAYREKIYRLVRSIPKGKVMTYGQIAVIIGKGYTARTVGHAMKVCDTDTVPWQRVINSRGACSTGRLTLPVNLQQQMLEAEGVIFSSQGRCDLNFYLWEPGS
jgi:methylated-DNA-protein-cysteine methyltransferase related protein